MKKRNLHLLTAGLLLLGAFALWTAAVCLVDVHPIGPNGSSVGFAALNGVVHRTLGVHWPLYTLTDWLGLVPMGFVFGFAILGLVQLIRRRSLGRVDRDILVLGGFYLVVLAAYLLFEKFAVNYRPVLIDGFLEASYPSSHTMLVICIMGTAIMQFRRLLPEKKGLHIFLDGAAVLLIVVTVVGRLLSGVHWFTDILAGVLLSSALVMLYFSALTWLEEKVRR